MFKSRPGQLLYQFLRVDAFDIISIVICVHAMKRQHEAWWRNGSAYVSSSEGCVFKSRPGQLFYQFLRVDAFDIISIVICVHAMKRQHEAWWRNGSASVSSLEGCVFKSHLGQLFYQFLRVDAFDIISIVISVHARKRQHMRPGGATVARVTPVQKVACSNHVRVNFFISFYE